MEKEVGCCGKRTFNGDGKVGLRKGREGVSYRSRDNIDDYMIFSFSFIHHQNIL
jgi:hypothetical protein